MTNSVVDLQRDRISFLEQKITELSGMLGKQLDINASLSCVLSHLTDGMFKEYAQEDNWSRVISEYRENKD